MSCVAASSLFVLNFGGVKGLRGIAGRAQGSAGGEGRLGRLGLARWRNTAQIKRSRATASIVTAERIVFNVKGNDYRLVVAVDFEKGVVWIKWIGTHRDDDRIDAGKVEHET